MSEIRVTTISDTAGTGPVTLTKQSAAKAFSKVNTAGDALLGTSLNVSSVTDVDTGRRELNLTNAMADIDSASCGGNAAGNIGAVYTNFVGNTSTLRLYFYNSSHAIADYDGSAFAFGDLA